MRKSSLFFSIYNLEEIDNDLEIETIADSIDELCKFFSKPKTTLYDKGIKKKKGLKVNLEINGKKYVVFVDEE